MPQSPERESPYGLHRVIGQEGVLPQPAERLDPSLPCGATELEIAVERLHVDASSLRQMRGEQGGNLAAVRESILELVAQRGKLHNRVTQSGGMLIGSVRRAGSRFPQAPAPGTRIATLASLTLTPLRLDELGPVDARSNAITARGTAFLFATSLWAGLPADIPDEVALAAFDVAGAPARTRLRTRPGMRVLVVGAGNSGLLSALAAVEAGAAQVTVTDLDEARLERVAPLKIPGVRLVHADASAAVPFAKSVGTSVDLTVSCVDRPGVEMACLLATRPEGHVLFFSMATSFARAALGAEGIGSGATLEIGNGYLPGHAEEVVGLLRRHRAAWDLMAPGWSAAGGPHAT